MPVPRLVPGSSTVRSRICVSAPQLQTVTFRYALQVESFIDRARELVTFLAENRGTADAACRLEEQLAEWITRWQCASHAGPGRKDHFLAEELGIIVRALSGPAPVVRHEGDNHALRWVIARCMVQNQ